MWKPRVYDPNLSDFENSLILNIGYGMQLPAYYLDNFDPTIEEICNVLDYYIKKNQLYGTKYIAKIDYPKKDNYGEHKIVRCVNFQIISSDLFKCHEERWPGFKLVDDSPIIIALDNSDSKEEDLRNKFPNENIFMKLNDGSIIPRSEYFESKQAKHSK